MSLREITLAWSALVIVGAVLFAPHVVNGGFYADDWADAAAALYPPGGSGFGQAVSYFNDLLSSCRPVLIVFLPLKYFVFGTNTEPLLALAIALAVIAAALLYAVLRTLDVPWYHAWLIAALTIAYPWFDSTRFWETASVLTLAAIFAFAGLWLALLGLSRNSWRLHAGAAFLYLLAMLTYEITLPLIALAGALYVLRAGWRVAKARWAIDLVMVVIAGLWAWTHTPRTVSDASGNLSHFEEIITRGAEMLGRTLLPVGAQPRTALALGSLAAIAAAGLAVYVLIPKWRTDRSGWGLREWLMLAFGGLIAAYLGWAIFVPADPYYTPVIFGMTNRVNGLAGFGLVIAVYGVLGIAGTLVGRLLRRGRPVATAVTLALGLMLGAAYAHVLDRHSDIWRAASDAEIVAADRIQDTFPRLPHGTAVFTSNYPANQTLGVPIFAFTWDLSGMMKLRYEDGTVTGYPLTSELQLSCLPNGVGLEAGEEIVASARYGTARLLDLSTGMRASPQSRRACLSVVGNYAPGPLYISTAY